jgi:CRP-like cAMP-binding protein
MGHAELNLQRESVQRATCAPLAPRALRTVLAGMPILRGVSSNTITLLAGGAEPLDLERGATVFERDSNPTGLFFVLEGSVKLLSRGADSRPRVVELFESGAMFGEIGVFTGAAYRTWTQTITPAKLIHINRKRVLAAVDQDHKLSIRMLTAVASRTQRLIDNISCTSPSAANVRVAAYLLELAQRSPRGDGHLTLPAPKGTIASLLNLSQESLSRVLRRMMDAGLLCVAGRQIRIQDRNGLIQMMDGEGGTPQLV